MKRLSFAFIAALVTNASADNLSASLLSAKNPFHGRASYRRLNCKLKDAWVLKKLYESTKGDKWKGRFKKKWTSKEPCSLCELNAVLCNRKKKKVQGLRLGKQIFNLIHFSSLCLLSPANFYALYLYIR